MNPPAPATKTVTVIGSTGLIGSKLVQNLVGAGHRIVEVSQSTQADVFTGEGLDDALAGADVVIDVVNSATPEDSAEAFFEQTSANLSAAAAAAGVGHYIVLSIVGADLLAPVAGYMRGKVAQEAAALASGVPWTVVRSTQFHELTAGITESLVVDDEVRVPVASIQTIASAELVEILAAIAAIAVGDPLDAIRGRRPPADVLRRHGTNRARSPEPRPPHRRGPDRGLLRASRRADHPRSRRRRSAWHHPLADWLARG